MHADTHERRTPLTLVLLSGFAAGLAGGFVAHWLGGVAVELPSEHPSGGASEGSAQVAAELRSLTAAVTAMGRRPAHEPSQESAPIDPARSSPEPLRPDSVASLHDAIASLAATMQSAQASRALPIERNSLSLPANSRAVRDALDALAVRESNEVRLEHLFLSVRDLVERYGLPDSVNVQERLVIITYRSADGRSWQRFWTLDGLVTGYDRDSRDG